MGALYHLMALSVDDFLLPVLLPILVRVVGAVVVTWASGEEVPYLRLRLCILVTQALLNRAIINRSKAFSN